MSASPSSLRERTSLRLAVVVGWICLLGVACQTPSRLPAGPLLEPLPWKLSKPPEETDLAAARLAEAALSDDRRGMERALVETRAASTVANSGPDKPYPYLMPLAHDLVNSTLEDPREYRAASRALLAQPDLNPALQARLEEAIEDDPLRLARKRAFDDWHSIFAHTFNAVSEPLGTSVVSGFTVAPYKLASSALQLGLKLLQREPLTLQERQALAHQKEFVARHPDSTEAVALHDDIAEAEVELHETLGERLARSAHHAIVRGEPHTAKALARRALSHTPDDERTQTLLARANEDIRLEYAHEGTTLLMSDELPPELARAHESGPLYALLDPNPRLVTTEERRLAEDLLRPGADYRAAAQALIASDPQGPLTDEASFAIALSLADDGRETLAWEKFDELSRGDPRRSNMARHAAHMVSDPWQNPYGTYETMRAQRGTLSIGHRLFGSSLNPPDYRMVPRPVEWVMALPGMAQSLISAPIRLLTDPLTPGRKANFHKPTANAGYRYLGLYPEGEHRREVLEWLYGYEKDQKNWPAALRLADFQSDPDPKERAELVEKVAEVRFRAAGRQTRRDRRSAALRGIVRDYPDSEIGHEAGLMARNEIEQAAPQRIRITRGFLDENPRVRGQQGLGLRPELRDGDLANGELHPEGVTLLGGQVIELAFIDEGGDEEAPPIRMQQQLSKERLARLVSLLDDTAQHNSQIDPFETHAPDAARDHYLERARLGLADKPDVRPTAESTYVYRGVRERYGLVRGREGILPFDIVVRGSIQDLGLGAFPRWRQPKQTPDAFLYK